MTRWLAVLLGCLFVLSGCGGGGGSDGGTSSPATVAGPDISGYWAVYDQSGGQDTFSDIIRITQNGTDLSVEYFDGEPPEVGTLDGNTFTIESSSGSWDGIVQSSGTSIVGTYNEPGGVSGSYRAELVTPSGDTASIQAVTLSAGDSYDFSTGTVNPVNSNDADLTYGLYDGGNIGALVSWDLGGGLVNNGISGWLPWAHGYSGFERTVLFPSYYLVSSVDPSHWHYASSIWDSSGADPTGVRPFFDARDRWVCLIETREGEYALAYVAHADQASMTLKYVYPW